MNAKENIDPQFETDAMSVYVEEPCFTASNSDEFVYVQEDSGDDPRGGEGDEDGERDEGGPVHQDSEEILVSSEVDDSPAEEDSSAVVEGLAGAPGLPLPVITLSVMSESRDSIDREETDETDETVDSDMVASDDLSEEARLVPDGRPIIKPSGGELPQILTRIQELLRATGDYFTSGKQIVAVRVDRLTGDAVVSPVSASRLSVVLSGAAAWLVPSGRGGNLRRIDAPDRYCTKLLEQDHFEVLQPLAGVARQPFLRPDGSLCVEPGYDPATGLYGVFMRSDYPVSAHPSRADAEAALGRLDSLLSEFPFVSEHDRSATLAAMLTAAVRPGLAVAPMFLVTAPEAGTGKTFLCRLIAAMATPRAVSTQTFPRSEAEADKILIAALRTSPPVVFFDNLNTDVEAFDMLCSMLTSEQASGRILGGSNMATVFTRTLMLASGNNVKPAKDMQRRCITISLDPRQEMPATRVFQEGDLLGKVMRNRGDFVADALTIVQAWSAEGSPMARCKPLVSYDAWSLWCRQPLLWLGKSDPAESAFTSMQEDPERQRLQQLLIGWNEAFGSNAVMVRDLVKCAESDAGAAALRDTLIEISDQGESINRRRVGRWIARHAGQVAGGLRIEPVKRTANAESWKVVVALVG